MIRELIKEDYENIKKLVYQVHKLHLEHRPDIYIDGNPLPIEYFNNIISDENSFCYVYEENNKIVGLLLALKKTNRAIPIAKQRNTYFIDDIVVDENNRRKGIGKSLYNFLLNKAMEEKIDAIELNVWAFNESAIRFYESIGMSVKNMKLEKIISNSNIKTKNIKINVTEGIDD